MDPTYKSKYTDKLITPAQLITDRLMENIAKKENKILPIAYWELEEYKKAYVRHIVGANRLLKKYPQDAILLALSDPAAKWIFYFENPKLKPLIEKHVRLNKEKESGAIAPKVDITKKPRQQVGKSGLLENLE
jgi:hypothetical protein